MQKQFPVKSQETTDLQTACCLFSFCCDDRDVSNLLRMALAFKRCPLFLLRHSNKARWDVFAVVAGVSCALEPVEGILQQVQKCSSMKAVVGYCVSAKRFIPSVCAFCAATVRPCSCAINFTPVALSAIILQRSHSKLIFSSLVIRRPDLIYLELICFMSYGSVASTYNVTANLALRVSMSL